MTQSVPPLPPASRPPAPPPLSAHPVSLEYASESGGRRLARRYHVIVGAASLGTWAVVCGVSCFVVPRFETIFKDFKTELPGFTKAVLSGSRWCVDYGWAMLFMVCGAVILAGLLIDGRATNDAVIKRYARFTVRAAVLVLTGFGVMITIGLALPIFALIDSVAGPK